MPRDAEMARLFEARRADDGEAWSAHPRKLSGVDLVFSPDKSVTLAAEFAPTPAESALIWNAIDRAADRAMRYVAQEVGWARQAVKGGEGRCRSGGSRMDHPSGTIRPGQPYRSRTGQRGRPTCSTRRSLAIRTRTSTTSS